MTRINGLMVPPSGFNYITLELHGVPSLSETALPGSLETSFLEEGLQDTVVSLTSRGEYWAGYNETGRQKLLSTIWI